MSDPTYKEAFDGLLDDDDDLEAWDIVDSSDTEQKSLKPSDTAEQKVLIWFDVNPTAISVPVVNCLSQFHMWKCDTLLVCSTGSFCAFAFTLPSCVSCLFRL